jgi:hypothetical protein
LKCINENTTFILYTREVKMKVPTQKIGYIVASIFIFAAFQNCSEVEALKSGKSIISYNDAVSASPHALPILNNENTSQAAQSGAASSPLNSNLVGQQQIQQQRDVRAGHISVVNGNVVTNPPLPPSSSGPDCECDQFNVGGDISLVAAPDATYPATVISNIIGISPMYVCSVAIPRPTPQNPQNVDIVDALTGTLTYFRCNGRGYGNTVFDYNVKHWNYRAPNGCQASGNPIQEDNSLSCRHQADSEQPFGVLSNAEFQAYAVSVGLNPSTGLPDNNPIPAPTCQDMYSLYFAISLPGQNSTYFPDVSFECRRIYFAAAYAGVGCYDDYINLPGGAQNTNPSGAEYCPIPENFNCQASANGCSN